MKAAVVVIEKQPLFREGLSRIIESENLPVVAKLARADDLQQSDLLPGRAYVVVIGSCYVPAATAWEIEKLKKWPQVARIVVLAENHDPAEVVMAFRAGADAYLANIAGIDALIKSLELVISGEKLLMSGGLSVCFEPHFVRGRTADAVELVTDQDTGETSTPKDDVGTEPRLSSREQMILSCLVAGASNKVIARRTGIAESTVKVHVKSIFRKIRALNRTQAAIWATRHQSFLTATNEVFPLAPGEGSN